MDSEDIDSCEGDFDNDDEHNDPTFECPREITQEATQRTTKTKKVVQKMLQHKSGEKMVPRRGIMDDIVETGIRNKNCNDRKFSPVARYRRVSTNLSAGEMLSRIFIFSFWMCGRTKASR